MRTAAKTGTYALTHFTVAVSVAYLLTGSAAAALAIGLVEPAIQTVAYVVHERLWAPRHSGGPNGAGPPPARA